LTTRKTILFAIIFVHFLRNRSAKEVHFSDMSASTLGYEIYYFKAKCQFQNELLGMTQMEELGSQTPLYNCVMFSTNPSAANYTLWQLKSAGPTIYTI
jgi:hypothetical protein